MVSAARPEMEQAGVKYGRFDGVRERLNGILIKEGVAAKLRAEEWCKEKENRYPPQGENEKKKIEKIEADVIMFYIPKGMFDSG